MQKVRNSTLIEYTAMKDMARCKYYNVVVQVIGIMVSDMNNVVLRCWDNTKVPWSRIFKFEESLIKEIVALDGDLELLAGDLAYDVILYGEHGVKARSAIKPKDVIILRNLHTLWLSGCACLALHDGKNTSKFNRGFDVLLDDNHLKIQFLRTVTSLSFDARSPNSPDSSINYRHNSFFNRSNPHASAESQMNIENLELHFDSVGEVKNEDRVKRILMINFWQIRNIALLINKVGPSDSQWRDSLYQAVLVKLPFFIRYLTVDCQLTSIVQKFLLLDASQRSSIIGSCLGRFASLISKFLIMKGLKDINEVPKDDKKNMTIEVELVKYCPGPFFTSWEISLQCPFANPVFVENCSECGFWMIVSRKDLSILNRLCLYCFIKKKNAPLTLKCFIPFYESGDRKSSTSKNVFLLPIEILRLFGVNLPETAVDAAKKWSKDVTNEQFLAVAAEVQEKMLHQYKFMLKEVNLRLIKKPYLVFEVLGASFSFK